MDKAIVDNYIKFFEHRLQSGGGSVEYPIYHGARYYQNGNGFGDSFGVCCDSFYQLRPQAQQLFYVK